MQNTSKKTCCFFGHRHLYDNEKDLYDIIKDRVEKLVEEGFSEFLFGGYGRFDELCYRVVKELKIVRPHIKMVYVMAYYKPHDTLNFWHDRYDEAIYPDLGECPKKFAITCRNQRIIDLSNFCIFYEKRGHGGAYQAMQYARRRGDAFVNIATS